MPWLHGSAPAAPTLHDQLSECYCDGINLNTLTDDPNQKETQEISNEIETQKLL